ncbi:MAG: S41 family peptidase [Bacteroidales bacterium]|nr:S41 family peptidase [Bacteroidales bacterium]
MKNIKPHYKIYLPLAFAVLLVTGMILGYWLAPGNIINGNLIPINMNRYDKVNDIINYISNEYVDSIGRNDLSEDAIEGLLGGLDPHSQYITAEEYNEVNDPLIGNFEGIGIEFRILDDTIAVILNIEDGPAESAGIMAGDRIVSVNDSIIAGKGITSRDAVKMFKGNSGSSVKVSIFRRGIQGLLDFELIRARVPSYSIDSYFMTNDSIGYIKLSKFSATTSEEFEEATLNLLNLGMKYLIFDLRGNTGGYLKAATDIADEFLENNKLIVYTEGYNRRRKKYNATESGNNEDIGLVVLMDERSASASEIIAGAIQDNDRGTIIGRRSYGKGLVQEQVDFRDGSALRLTVARYFTPTGRCIQKPYNSVEGFEDYYYESYNRYSHSDTDRPDTLEHNDSLKFYTPEGKVVYGGGGIMPDIFIPIEMDNRYRFYNDLIENDLIFRFAFNKQSLYEDEFIPYSSIEGFSENYFLSDRIWADFLAFVEKKGVNGDSAEINFARAKIKNILKAYFARNLFRDAGFYPVLLQTDSVFIKAKDFIQNKTDLSFGRDYFSHNKQKL